jgi:hypothetical protein
MTSGIANANSIEKILSSKYDYKMISAGNNFPSVDLASENLGSICILLHEGFSIDQISKYFKWSHEEINKKIELLLKDELIKKNKDGEYKPNIMVITLKDNLRHLEVDNKLVNETIQIILSKMLQIKKRYKKIDGLKNIDFSDASLLLLSNVILDNWQIRNIERLILNKPRTKRNGMNYYYSIQENEYNKSCEAFGIFGNSYISYNDIGFALYGNQREKVNFRNLSTEKLIELFKINKDKEHILIKEHLLDEFVKYSQDVNYKLSDAYKNGFESLGFIKNNKFIIPILYQKDILKLSEIAALFTDDLSKLLAAHVNDLKKKYNASNYSREISFEEFFIWWYHLYYTKVTDELISMNYIKKPESGVFTYLVINK